MATLASMPPIEIDEQELAQFGEVWLRNGQNLKRTPPYSSGQLGQVFDLAVAKALARMLGGIPVVTPSSHALIPAQADCVEAGPVRMIGGVRQQNFDVGYRPDGVRFVFDSKTLNDKKSIGKNFKNMVNDLASEATNVHSRFPHALVTFIFICPSPCLTRVRQREIIETLERLARRTGVDGPVYIAEAISLVVCNPNDGTIISDVPNPPPPILIK